MENKDKPAPKIIATKTYTVTATMYDNGTNHLHRVSDGFNGYELLGILELTQLDIVKQIAGEIKPKKVTRKVIVDQ